MRRSILAFFLLLGAIPAWSQITLSLTPLSTPDNPFVSPDPSIGPLSAGTVQTNPTGLTVTLTTSDFLWFSTDGTCDPSTISQQIQIFTSPVGLSDISVCLINLPTGGTFFALITASTPTLPTVSAAASVTSFPGGEVTATPNVANISGGAQQLVIQNFASGNLSGATIKYAAGIPTDWLAEAESPDCSTIGGGGSCTVTLSAIPGAQDGPNSVYTAQIQFTATDNGIASVGAISVTYTVPAVVAPPPPPPPPPSSNALLFVPITPCRVADTRNTNGTYGPSFGAPSLGAGDTRNFPLPSSGRCNIPLTAAAYSLNVTAVTHGYLGYLTVWPTGQSQPGVSTLNSWDGRTKANAVILPAGNTVSGGGVSVFSTDEADVILDINGYFVPPPQATALQFFRLTPCRIFDTRNPAGPLGAPSFIANETRDIPVLQSNCSIPSGVQAYSLNMTAIPKAGVLNFLATWPSDKAWSGVSTLNATTGTTTANAAIVPAAANGDISVLVSEAADVFADINGYFAPAASGGLGLYNLPPCRVVDTADPAGSPTFTGMLSPVLNPTCGVPATAQALVLNATVQAPGSFGFLTLWEAGYPQPLASTLNAFDGATTSNLAIVPAMQGMISAYASNPGYLILDVSGYFAP